MEDYQIPIRSNLPQLLTTRHRCNLWSVCPGAKLRSCAPLTRDTRKGIKRI